VSSEVKEVAVVDRPVSRPGAPTSYPLELTDPRPLAAPDAFWRQVARFAVIGIFLIMFGAFLDLARLVLLPAVSAAVVGVMLGPLARLAARARVPAWLFATATVLILMGLLQALTVMVSAPLIDWAGKLPEFTSLMKEKLQPFESSFAALRTLQDSLSRAGAGGAGAGIDLASIGQATLGFLTPALGEVLLFFATLYFVLLDRDDLRRGLILMFKDQDDRLRVIRILNDIERNLSRYIGTVTVINFGVGLITAAGAWLLGFSNPALLGAAAFVANYIPYVGPAVMLVVLFVVGVVSFSSLAYAGLAPLLYVGLTTIEGHFVTPNIVGRRLTLNPLAVFLSLAFWTWLWGPVGAFLSVPLLIFGLVIANHLVFEEEGELPA
jgi:predicted PurR-regulated permease PerM